MKRRRNPLTSGRGGWSLILLLVLAILASSLIAYRAVRAQRLHRDRAAATLDDYALFAAWELSRNVEEVIQHALNMTLWPVNRVGAVSGDDLPRPSVLEEAQGREMECDCPLPLAARYYFRLDLASGAMESEGERLSDDLTRTLLAETPAALGDRMQSHWRGMLLDVSAGGERHLMAVAALPDDRGRARALYGLGVDPGSLAPLVADVLASAPLLPGSLAANRPNDSILVVTLRSPAGEVLFRSPGPASEHEAAQRLSGTLGGLEITAALRTDVLSSLGSVPDSETPLLLMLLLGTAILFALAVRDLRRRAAVVALRSDFVASVSHELRTPLAQIQLFSETLLMKRERSEAERTRFLRIVQEEAQRLTHLVENVLRFAHRGRDERSESAPAVTEVCALVSTVTRGFQPLVEDNGTDIELVTPEEEIWVPMDAGALRQVLLNLLDNALKYGPRGQTIRVGVLCARPDRVEVRVEDEGPGVPRGERQKIFEPFTRGNGRSASVTGAGIGLTIVRDLVSGAGGEVRVEAAARGGARFVVRLPRAEAPPYGVEEGGVEAVEAAS